MCHDKHATFIMYNLHNPLVCSPPHSPRGLSGLPKPYSYGGLDRIQREVKLIQKSWLLLLPHLAPRYFSSTVSNNWSHYSQRLQPMKYIYLLLKGHNHLMRYFLISWKDYNDVRKNQIDSLHFTVKRDSVHLCHMVITNIFLILFFFFFRKNSKHLPFDPEFSISWRRLLFISASDLDLMSHWYHW